MSRSYLNGRRVLLALAVLAAAVLLAFLPGRLGAFAEGEDGPKDTEHVEQYQNGYYEGEVTMDSTRIRKAPGTKTPDGKKEKKGDLDDTVKTSGGKDVILAKGTKVYVVGESKDSDGDMWYHVKFTYSGEELEGYAYHTRVKRKDAQITFSPTPTTEPTATEVPPTPTEEQQKGELINAPTPTQSPETENMVEQEKKNPNNKWKYFAIIVGVIIIGGIAFTVITHFSEKKIDEEMHRNSRHYEVERLEGESEEDFREARKSAFKGQLKDQSDRDIAEEIGIDEFKLDLDGVFDDEDATQGAVSEAVTEAVTEDAAAAIVSDAAEAAEAATGDWSDKDEAFLKHLSENADEQEKALIAQIVPNYPMSDEAAVTEEEEDPEPTPEELLRVALDDLKEQDTLVHKEYGVGEVIDNSDPQVIQVRFGRDLRFLKKDRLARKQLVEL
ncbi:MAG: hypothetical protein J5645_08775 [Lachnospiraceae bacterium]|nr:hypothetical protein [Lachnospiraceae bacterium]